MDLAIVAVVGISTIGGIIVMWPTTKMALDMAPYLTTNTRCSARQGLLLTGKHYTDLLSAASEQELFAILEDTAYAKIAEQNNTPLVFSKALEEDWHATTKWLEYVAPEPTRGVFEALSDVFEIIDIKRLLNNLRHNEPAPELPHIRDHALKLKLEATTDIAGVASILEETQYSRALQNKDIQKDLGIIVTALDLFAIERVWKEIAGISDAKVRQAFEEYWRTKIDLANLHIVLRKCRGITVDLPLLDDGYISSDEWHEITDESGLETAMGKSPYANFLTKGDIYTAERALYKFMHNQGGNISAKYPLKGGNMVQYLIKKELELRNLQLVVKLKADKWEEEHIQPLLIQ